VQAVRQTDRQAGRVQADRQTDNNTETRRPYEGDNAMQDTQLADGAPFAAQHIALNHPVVALLHQASGPVSVDGGI
jgi:hypothetical protein